MNDEHMQQIAATHATAIKADTERLESAAQLAKQELPKGDTGNPFLCWVIANHWRDGIPPIADDNKLTRFDLECLFRDWKASKS